MLVILESPFKGTTPQEQGKFKKYLNKALRHSIMVMDEAPLASHPLYTGALDDSNDFERIHGICLLDNWLPYAKRVVVYADYGVTEGMKHRIDAAVELRIPVEYRYILGPKRG